MVLKLLLSLVGFALLARGQPSAYLQRDVLEVYSFDYSAHTVPLAYQSHRQTVDLVHKTKLIPAVRSNYGAFFLKKVSVPVIPSFPVATRDKLV
jgi:hypothetical protein